MSNITIENLSHDSAMDREAMDAVIAGRFVWNLNPAIKMAKMTGKAFMIGVNQLARTAMNISRTFASWF